MADKERTSKRYLSEAEAAEILGVAERTLRDWRRKGRIDGKGTKPPRAYVRGRHIYYREDELVAWIREGATDVGGVSVRMRKKRGNR
ncbi:helix-turn-helix domain-containing protein [uncultured Cloacibacillus sp.]|uniref:helix-turn-helix domain-containing protein n=1 Tax=uncultured Cloacibacillus sp. TaxID=889794 RepID=UPI0026DBF138|nr:helix-turn-helix domain-containing protein [uncultured Cloacibacillus sp.]